MNKINGKRLIGAGFALLALAATMGFTSCASSTPFEINFINPPGALPNATVGAAYYTQVAADGVTGPPTGVYTYSIDSGSLPSGITLATVNTTGVNSTSIAAISGTDTRPGDHGKTFTFTVKAVDTLKVPNVGISGEYTITVN
jgi:hypothetical protein